MALSSRHRLAANRGDRCMCVLGFLKNERSSIGKDETEALKKLATHLLSFTAQALDTAQRAGALIKVDCDA